MLCIPFHRYTDKCWLKIVNFLLCTFLFNAAPKVTWLESRLVRCKKTTKVGNVKI